MKFRIIIDYYFNIFYNELISFLIKIRFWSILYILSKIFRLKPNNVKILSIDNKIIPEYINELLIPLTYEILVIIIDDNSIDYSQDELLSFCGAKKLVLQYKTNIINIEYKNH
jgi:hypothetical protein